MGANPGEQDEPLWCTRRCDCRRRAASHVASKTAKKGPQLPATAPPTAQSRGHVQRFPCIGERFSNEGAMEAVQHDAAPRTLKEPPPAISAPSSVRKRNAIESGRKQADPQRRRGPLRADLVDRSLQTEQRWLTSRVNRRQTHCSPAVPAA